MNLTRPQKYFSIWVTSRGIVSACMIMDDARGLNLIHALLFPVLSLSSMNKEHAIAIHPGSSPSLDTRIPSQEDPSAKAMEICRSWGDKSNMVPSQSASRDVHHVQKRTSAYLGPKSAVPIRTILAPSSMAIL